MTRFAWIAAVAAAIFAATGSARAQTAANTTVKWYGTAIVKLTLTPNYAAGFGSVKAVFGTQPTPAHGPDAVLDGGAVDFGSVLSGAQYLYKYAVHLNVFTNSPTGFNVFGEGAADFVNQTDSTTQSISQTLYYVNSTSGSPAVGNNGFSPALPFYHTVGSVTGGDFATSPTITYAAYPAPIASSAAATGDFYYDYELKVPALASTGAYFVWIVYTVVPQ
jgi:hypothetical protein